LVFFTPELVVAGLVVSGTDGALVIFTPEVVVAGLVVSGTDGALDTVLLIIDPTTLVFIRSNSKDLIKI
jgi:hypothetical protein